MTTNLLIGFQIFLNLVLSILCSFIIASVLNMKMECFPFCFLYPYVLTTANSI